jgi:hypothetical protein
MTTETQTTLAAFILAHGIRMRVGRASRNPNMNDAGNMDHWLVLFRNKAGRSLTTHFSMGVGLGGKEPTAEDVLDCLASDSSSIENAFDFEEWASNFGYDTDSREAERTYRACERQAGKLKRFLGDEAYELLLWNVERQ